MTIGLIGYGRFGRLAARFLVKHARLVVYDMRAKAPRSGKIRRGTLREAAGQAVVILAVPISSLRSTLRAIRPHVRAGALVMDVCTVKTKPVTWMNDHLPRSVEILGTHPLFGPDSAHGSLRGHRVVLTPIRISRRRLGRIRALLRREGLLVLSMTPDRHDRMIAETILLTHYVGRLVHYAGLKRWEHGTVSYGKLLSVVDVATNDSLQLLQDVWRYNPYSRSLARALQTSFRRLTQQLSV